MVDRYLNGTVQETPAGVAARRYGPTYARLFRRQFLSCAKALLDLPGLAASCRRAFRPRYAAPQDGYNALVFVRIDTADRARLEACASTWGITAHDLLLAILLKGLAPLTVRRLESSTRNEIAVASIVNIRRDLGTEASEALAPYLPPVFGLRDGILYVEWMPQRCGARTEQPGQGGQTLPADADRHGHCGHGVALPVDASAPALLCCTFPFAPVRRRSPSMRCGPGGARNAGLTTFVPCPRGPLLR
jgi:hypothetical protein